MERQLRMLMFSITAGWTIAIPIGMAYLLLHIALWYQSPPAPTILGFVVNYGLISGGIGGLSIALGLRFLGRMGLSTTLGLTLGWAVSLAVGLILGWLLTGQNTNNLLLAILIGMTIGGSLGGVLTGYTLQQVVSTARHQSVWRIAVGWAISFLIGNGMIVALIELSNRFPIINGFGWLLVLTLLSGAIAGAIGSRIMVQQIS